MERALQESEERYRRLVELSPVAISVYKDGQFVYVNPAGMKVAGASRPEDIVGTNPLDWVHPDDKEFARKRMENTFLNWYSSPAEHRVIRLDGEIIDVMVTAIYDPKSLSAQLVYEDITARKQAEQLIRQSEDRYIRLQNSLDEFSLGLFGVMKVSEMERRLVKEVQVVLNSAHVSLIEIDRNNHVNMKSGNHDIPDTFLKEILNSDQRPYPVCEIMEASEGYFLKIGEIRGKCYILCVGEKAPALRIKPKRVWLKTITRYVNVLYDSFRLIEDLTKELEQSVAQHAAPSWLLRLVFNLSENERKRLSQDLHDAALQEQIIWYRKLDQLSTDRSVPQEIREQLEQMAQGLLDVIYQIRITCNELRPPLLKEEGLVSSLEALFEFTQLRTNYCIQFDAAAFHHNLNDHLLIGIYRIVQELMANATKHSNASRVRVTLSSFPDRVELNYEDDGIGMDLTGLEDSFNSMGVYGMKERVRSMEGKIVFHSSPNEGLAIFISIPAL